MTNKVNKTKKKRKKRRGDKDRIGPRKTRVAVADEKLQNIYQHPQPPLLDSIMRLHSSRYDNKYFSHCHPMFPGRSKRTRNPWKHH